MLGIMYEEAVHDLNVAGIFIEQYPGDCIFLLMRFSGRERKQAKKDAAQPERCPTHRPQTGDSNYATAPFLHLRHFHRLPLRTTQF